MCKFSTYGRGQVEHNRSSPKPRPNPKVGMHQRHKVAILLNRRFRINCFYP